jgi:prolyl 4-hydroxylase
VQPVLEEWAKVKLTPTDMYGMRVYTAGAVLNNHVDRVSTHAISVIINVAQDVEEPWPLEIVDHKGVAHNVTIKTGDMVLYESASCIHGRPWPLLGRAFVNVFCHYRPTENWNFDY